MSRTEAHIGKIRKVEILDNETFEETCLRLWIAEGQKEIDYCKGELLNQYYDKYLKCNDVIWEKIEDKEFDTDESYCNLTFNEDGTVSYQSVFYNGGTYLDEMIEYELKKHTNNGTK